MRKFRERRTCDEPQPPSSQLFPAASQKGVRGTAELPLPAKLRRAPFPLFFLFSTALIRCNTPTSTGAGFLEVPLLPVSHSRAFVRAAKVGGELRGGLFRWYFCTKFSRACYFRRFTKAAPLSVRLSTLRPGGVWPCTLCSLDWRRFFFLTSIRSLLLSTRSGLAL